MASTCLLAATACLGACSDGGGQDASRAELVAQESADIDAWFAARWQDRLSREPMLRSELGVGERHDRLDATTRMAMDERAALDEAWLGELTRSYDPARLDPDSALSHRLFAFAARDRLDAHAQADRTYAFTHMTGAHAELPSFLINTHDVETVEDARDYVARLQAADDFLGGARERAEAQAADGVLLPRFVYPKMSTAARNVITGAPFTDGPDSPIWADVKTKFIAANMPPAERATLLVQARDALLSDVQPAYLALLDMFSRHEALATEDDGVWKIDESGEYYASRLKHYTTLELDADEIHEIGLREVAAIKEEMEAIRKEVGFAGNLRAFFDHLRTSPEFTFPNTDAGREIYIEGASAYIEEMKGRLDELFITQPVADVVVKRVEPFREASAFGAFYNRPAQDGSRPGTYYINLKDMDELPIYQMQALAYHEGIPGHHMQIAIAQELDGVPEFRKTAIHVPYVEGWALYSEAVPAELGLYTDPYQRFGQLSMALFRAARLVVDTGIHHKRWTRDEAVAYMLENTANSEGDVRAEVDRYIVWPGQATAYMIGKLKIEELRADAEERLGDSFDLREFHDAVLSTGSVPLPILEDQIETYITSKDPDA